MRPDTPSHEGCPWCCKGHTPQWKFNPNGPDGEWVHEIREKTGAASERITMVVCTGANQPSK